MKRFKNILYFLDSETIVEPALKRAIILARQNRARLTLMDVLEPFDIPKQLLNRAVTQQEHIIERRRSEILYLLEGLDHDDIEVDIQLRQGIPFIEVIQMVHEEHFELLIKAPRPKTGFYTSMLGSTDLHLLRKCPCPVWIEKGGYDASYQSILAAVDCEEEPGVGCLQLIMDLASSMAVHNDARLSVVHAWSAYGETALSNPWLGFSDDQINDIINQSRQHHEHKLDERMASYGLSSGDENVHLVHGHPGTSILKTADAVEANLIVLGTAGRTGIPGFIIGNTAEDVLQNTSASILAIKPDGFVSPVTPRKTPS